MSLTEIVPYLHDKYPVVEPEEAMLWDCEMWMITFWDFEKVKGGCAILVAMNEVRGDIKKMDQKPETQRIKIQAQSMACLM